MLYLASQNVMKKWTQLVPWLGSGDWPAHPAVRGTPNAVSVKEKAGTAQISKDENRSELIPSAFIVLPENPSLFQRPGVGRAHELKIL